MVIFITFVQFALIVGVVIYLAVNMLNLVRVDPAAGLIPNLPFISVCVPARDEERSISLCLTSLLNQDYPQYEVIAIDDHSKDNTLEIMRTLSRDFPNLKIIKGAQLPPDWYGKSFALHQAYKQARGEYLLFTDADPVFKSHALTSAIVFMKTNNLDMLTLMPGTQLVTFWEITIQPVVFAFISGLTRFRKVNTLSYPNSMGIGAFILIKRKVYQAIGGHESVKKKIVEDIELAKCVKQSGYNLVIADGKSIYCIRMYHSLKEIWIGWRKNIFVALKRSVLRTLYYSCIILCFQVTPYIVLFYNLMVGGSIASTILALLGLILVVITGTRLCGELRMPAWPLFLFPFGAIMMVMIMLHSMMQILIKGHTEWRGRKV